MNTSHIDPTIKLATACLILAFTGLAVAGTSSTRLFRSTDELTIIKIFAADRLELTTKDGPHVCSYSRDSASLRVVVTSLGGVQVLMFKMLPIGLEAPDGTILYDESHFADAARSARHRK
jgi:hypothetical protein